MTNVTPRRTPRHVSKQTATAAAIASFAVKTARNIVAKKVRDRARRRQSNRPNRRSHAPFVAAYKLGKNSLYHKDLKNDMAMVLKANPVQKSIYNQSGFIDDGANA